MTDATAPTHPCAHGGDAAPVCDGTLPCCWTQDVNREITTAGDGAYFQKFDPSGSRVSVGPTARYTMHVHLSRSEIEIEMKLKVERQSGVSEADETAVRTRLSSGVTANWGAAGHKIKVVDPSCGEKELSVKFSPVFVDSGQHITVKLHASYPREDLTGDEMNVNVGTVAWVYAHEFGHAFGLADEYSYTSGETHTVKYVKPSGGLGPAISAPYNGKPSTEPDCTIMSTHSNTTIEKYHFWPFAIEAQAILRGALGREVTCTVV